MYVKTGSATSGYQVRLHLDGQVNRQTTCSWSHRSQKKSVRQVEWEHEYPAWSPSAACTGPLAPYWFQHGNGKTVTIDKERHHDVLRKVHGTRPRE